MKTLINYNYNLFPNEITKVKGNYYFFVENSKYYIVKLNRPVEDLKLLILVNSKLEQTNNAVYKILFNLKKEYYFEYEGNTYILMQVIGNETYQMNLLEILKFNSLVKTKEENLLNRNDWKKLWSEKVDYLEYQLSVLGENDPLINESFSYYIGLAENAISYYTDSVLEENIKPSELVISHKRIKIPVLSSYIFNPLNFIFDYDMRDLAEYIKIKFFNNCLEWNEVEDLFYNKFYSRASLRLLYARLLYPSYYFDAYERYIKDKTNKKELKKIISKSDEYEELLFDIYFLIKKIVPIPEIEWILKNKRV